MRVRVKSKLYKLRHREYQERYRAKQLGKPVEKMNFIRIWGRSDKICPLCSELISSIDDAEFDHTVALVNDGEHSETNIQVVHRKCNRVKGRK